MLRHVHGLPMAHIRVLVKYNINKIILLYDLLKKNNFFLLLFSSQNVISLKYCTLLL